MKHNTSVFILIAVILLSAIPLNAQNYYADTVWTKETDQSMGFYQVKFSNNDSIIVGHGYEHAIFYNAFNGEEIARIPSNAEVHFFDNDLKYIQLVPTKNKLIIYDSKTHIQLDTIEHDGSTIGKIDISNDGRFIAGVILGGLRIWSLETKRIFLTKLFDNIPGLTNINVGQIKYYCDDSKILIQVDKTYQISISQPKQTTENNITIFDANTLDSINNYYGYFDFRLSRTCKYIAFITLETTYGIDIYNFSTKKLIRRLPINGPSLTGIEFSPDDKYIVTSGHGIIIWDINTGLQTHFYPGDWQCIDISHDGKTIISNGSQDFWMWISKFGGTPVPSIQEIYKNVYPNPTTGEVNINTSLKQIETIKIYDIKGNEYSKPDWQESQDGLIQINVSPLTNGKYIIKIAGLNEVQSFNLIINK